MSASPRQMQYALRLVPTKNVDANNAPAKTKNAFAEVTAAQTTQGTLVSEAEQYRVKTASEAEAEVVELLAEAETYRKQVVAEVMSQSIYFKSIYEAYKNSPDTVLMALYNQTLADVLENQDGTDAEEYIHTLEWRQKPSGPRNCVGEPRHPGCIVGGAGHRRLLLQGLILCGIHLSETGSLVGCLGWED